MENLGEDLAFNGEDIDPNQLEFASVTEANYSAPSTSGHNMLAHVESRVVVQPNHAQLQDIPLSGAVSLPDYSTSSMNTLDSEGITAFLASQQFNRTDDNQIDLQSDLFYKEEKSLSYMHPPYNPPTTSDNRSAQYQPGMEVSYSSSALPSVSGLLPAKGSNCSSYDMAAYQQPVEFRQPEFLPQSSAPISMEGEVSSANNEILQQDPNFSDQRLNNSRLANAFTQLLLSGALPQSSELLNQLSLQLQNQGLSIPRISSMVNSLANSSVAKALVETISIPPEQLNLPSSSNVEAYPMNRPSSSLSNHSQEQLEAVEPRPSTSNDDVGHNEPEMMIYHDKMTRKNILVPIGPAGRNMAPSPMFLDENHRPMNQPQVTAASSSNDIRPDHIIVSDFLNLPARDIPREATPAPSKLNHSRVESPSDNFVSSTTQDIREDLPPLREILPRHNEVIIDSTQRRDHFSLSSFNATAAASSNEVMSFGNNDHHPESTGMLLPVYEPISDSEDGEISTTCIGTRHDDDEEERNVLLPSARPMATLPQLHQAMIAQQLPTVDPPAPRATFSGEEVNMMAAQAVIIQPIQPQMQQSASVQSDMANREDYVNGSGGVQEEFNSMKDESEQVIKALSPMPYPTNGESEEDLSLEDSREGELMTEEAEVAEEQREEVTIQIDDSQLVLEDGEKKWKCNLCPKTYSSKHNLLTHILSHNGIKPHQCLLCGKLFKQQSHLHTHMLTHGNVKPHMCKICKRSFTQASHVKRHMAVHMEKRPHICTVCERGFVFPSELKIHMAKHKSGKSNVCADCDESFSSLKKLRLHMQQNHKDVSALTCPECGKTFTYPSQLKDHMLKHEGKRPFICSECGMDFVKEHHLKAHAFTHTGLKPFACDVCNRQFNQKANLLRHMVVHEDKKYECKVCKRAFSQAQVLKAHMVTHADKKPHTCKICGKGFSRLHNLNGHMHMHNGEKPHTCFCGASFTLKGNLNRHKKEKHNFSEHQMPTEEEAALILNEMSAGHRSRVNSEDSESSPVKRRTSVRQDVHPSNEKHAKPIEGTMTTDLSGIDLISRFVSINDDANSVNRVNAAASQPSALPNIEEEETKRKKTKRGKKSESPLLSVLPPPILVCQIDGTSANSAAKNGPKQKSEIVLPPKRRVSEIEKEAGLL